MVENEISVCSSNMDTDSPLPSIETEGSQNSPGDADSESSLTSLESEECPSSPDFENEESEREQSISTISEGCEWLPLVA